jgi:hypothetical protein
MGAAEETPPRVEKPAATVPPPDRPIHTPIPQRPPSPEKDLSELLDAVREAAVTHEPTPDEETGDRAPKPQAGKRKAVWPPPPPSEEDEEE